MSKDIDKILIDSKNKAHCWDHECFENVKKRLHEHDDFVVHPFEVEEGVIQCLKCNSKRTYTYSKQTRGSDEPTSIFAQCVKCNNRWTYSG